MLRFAGSSVAAYHLDIMLAAGCSRIACVTDELDAVVLDLQHRAEAGGAAFAVVKALHALVGTLTLADEVLVIAADVFPERASLLAVLDRPAVLSFPAAIAVPRGFERIDAGNAWAGALLASGAVVERLAGLPADCEPASTLLRVALQAGTARRELSPGLVERGEWLCAPSQDELDERAGLVARSVANLTTFTAPATAIVERMAMRVWLDRSSAGKGPWLPLAATGAGICALGAAFLEWPAVSFALVALMAALLVWGTVFGRIDEAVFGKSPAGKLSERAGGLLDPVLALCAAAAAPEDQGWLRLYVPALMVVALRLATRYGPTRWKAPLQDRIALALAAVPAAWLGMTQVLAAAVTGLALIALSLGARPGND